MRNLGQPILEFTVILWGMLLAYLPVRAYLRQSPLKLACWLSPLLIGLSVSEGILCFFLNLPVWQLLFPTLPVLLFLYHKTLHISIWKSGSIFLAVCAVLACVNSFSRAVNAIVTADLTLTENALWFDIRTGIFYNAICLLFVLLVWYPAVHSVRAMVEDENFAQTWYVFWILPSIFIGLNLFMVPKYRNTLYTGRILQGYIVISLVLLVILVLFYAMFLMMASSLNKNARLQHENHLLSLERVRYQNLCDAIEETRRIRHDMRHYLFQLSSYAENGNLEKIKDSLQKAGNKFPTNTLHFCENQTVDNILGYYSALARQTSIPFEAIADLPAQLSIDEIDLGLILSNLIENAVQASQQTELSRRKIHVMICVHGKHLLLIEVKNTYDGKIQQKDGIFQSTKHKGNGIGIQSVCHISKKNGGTENFNYDNGIFIARIMLRI